MLTAEHLRAARAMLRWDQTRLARSSGVSVETVRRLEALDGRLASAKAGTLDALQRALEAAGVEFTNGGQPGVRLKMETLIIHGAPALSAPLKETDRVRFRPGRAFGGVGPEAIGVVSWVEPRPIRMGPVPRIRVRFGDYETPDCMPSEFELIC